MSLDAFKGLFSKKADANIEKVKGTVAKYEAKLVEFNEIWPQAMAEAEGLGIGETFVKMFPEGGGFGGGDPFQGLKTEYVNLLQYGEPFSPWVKRLYKLEKSATRLKRSKRYLKQVAEYKEDGAEAYLLKVQRGIGGLIAGLGKPDAAWDNFIKFGDKWLADQEEEDNPIESYSRRFDPRVEGPRGVVSSPELFILIKEQGNPLSKLSEESNATTSPIEKVEEETVAEIAPVVSPPVINEEEEKTIEEELETEAINQPEEAAALPPISEEAPINALETKSRKLIKVGSKGDDVKFLQKALGIDDDGIFGPLTKAAVIKFQEDNGLDIDGIVGEGTWAAINKLETVEGTSNIEAVSPEVQTAASINEISNSEESTNVTTIDEGETSIINEGDNVSNIENTNVTNVTAETKMDAEDAMMQSKTGAGVAPAVSTPVINEKLEIEEASPGVIKGIPQISKANLITSGPATSADSANILQSTINNTTENLGAQNITSNVSNISNILGGGGGGGETTSNILGGTNISKNLSKIGGNVINEEGDSITSNLLSNVTGETKNISDSSVTGGLSKMLSSKSITNAAGNLEVNKNKLSVDRKVAPLSTPSQISNSTSNQDNTNINNSTSESLSESISKESNVVDNSKTTNNETSNTNNTGDEVGVNVDMTMVEMRLKRIEHILLGPLDVNIVTTS